MVHGAPNTMELFPYGEIEGDTPNYTDLVSVQSEEGGPPIKDLPMR